MTFDIVHPLLGFEDIKAVELHKIDDIFMKMQSSTDEHISFTMINPFVLREYDFEIPDQTKEHLSIDENANLLILNIVLIQTPIEDSVVKLHSPYRFQHRHEQSRSNNHLGQ
ncbi:MAG: flagellar assembly protein FliW [Campylobacterota bacterium]|nr:flagellar assembly protein FliW [Campylobacterota bacterium]